MHFEHVFWSTWDIEIWIASAVFCAVLLAMLLAFGLSGYRRWRSKGPSRVAKRNKLELGYAAALFGVSIFLINLSFTQNHNFWSAPPAALTVRATGFQWCWDFTYVGDRVQVSGQCAGGPLPTLVVPAGRNIRFQVTSKDVIHGFWIPALKIKTYAYPGHVNYFTMSALPPGRWLGHCNEFCGLYHYGMMFHLQAVPPAQFNRWLHANGGPARAVRP
ncbi:MAG: cytochrome c oxidase subunit II [Micromonosporaceae bacterium]